MRKSAVSGLAVAILFALPLAFSASGLAATKDLTPTATPVSLPLKPHSVRFGVIGDSGTGSQEQYEIGKKMDSIHKTTDFGFVIMLGDNLYGGHAAGDFQKKFELPYKPLLDEGVKFYASLGNHDNTDETAYAPFNMNGRRYYTFSQENAQFFVLDSNYMDGPQLNWLNTELQKSTADWKIAYFHHPLYSSGKRHGSDTDLRGVLEPVFKKYRVNVVLSGHDHIYERFNPQSEITYFVLGNSGQLRSGGLDSTSQEAAGFDSDRCFMVVEITGDQMFFQTVSRSGQVVDSGIVNRAGTATPVKTADAKSSAQTGLK